MVTNPLTPRHEAALAYARQGIAVFPCAVNGKHPVTANGFKDRSSDAEQINAWWSQGDYNIAVVPDDCGWGVVDIDPRDGGADTWQSLVDQNGIITTREVKTPSGGRHLYFRGSLPPSAGSRLGAGLDTRGRGSYVLVPPSYVVDEKKGYQGAYTDALDIDPVPLPQWIVDKMGTPAAPRQAVEGVDLDTAFAIEEGIREIRRRLASGGIPEIDHASDTRTFELACRLKDFALSSEKCNELLTTHWAPHFDDDWIAVKVASAFKNGQNEPGSDRPKSDEEAFGTAPKLVDAWKEQRGRVRLGKKGIARQVEWLWPGFLARGMFHILAGEPSAGKSTLAFALAAQLSVGGTWPDGSPTPIANTLIWSGEDPWPDVIEPRLLACGADLERVDYIDGIDTAAEGRSFDPSNDIPLLLETAEKMPDLRLLILDPVVSAVKGDDHHNNDVRKGLEPLVRFAERRGVTVLGISHFTKNSEGKGVLDRLIGSRGYGALARVVLAAAADEEGQRRMLVRAKSNIGPDGGGFEYGVEQAPTGLGWDAQRAVFGKPLTGAARSLLAEIAPEKDAKQIELARNIILQQLAEGPRTTAEIEAAMTFAGISKATMGRARRGLADTIEVMQQGRVGEWQWRVAQAKAPADDVPLW